MNLPLQSPIAVYEGEGTFATAKGASHSTNTTIVQAPDGRIYMVALDADHPLLAGLEPILKYEGRLRDGTPVVAEPPIHAATSPLQVRDDQWSHSVESFILSGVVVGTSGLVKTVRYGLANFEFSRREFPHKGRPPDQRRPCSHSLTMGHATVPVVLHATSEYESQIDAVITTRGIGTTAELELPAESDWRLSDERATTLCELISVARGTKVQWLYRKALDDTGKVISTLHVAHVTKPFSRRRVIPMEDSREGDLWNFLSRALAVYVERREFLRLRPNLALYLEAKTDMDYLEVRAIKSVVALEAIKAAYLEGPGAGREFVMDPTAYEALVPDLVQALAEAFNRRGVPSEQIDRLTKPGAIGGLNRTSFISALGRLCRYARLRETGDLEQIVACRNSLVHAGRFYCECASEAQRARTPPPVDGVAEYSLLIGFLDRLVLKLLGYSGRFVDWSKSTKARMLDLPADLT